MNVKLVVVQGKPAGKTLLLSRGEYYLGRGEECQVRFDSDWVSRQHCLLRISAEGVQLRDLGSRNGTLLNGTLLNKERTLRNGDQIQVGPVVFEVRIDPSSPGAKALPPKPLRSDTDEPSRRDSLDTTAPQPVLPRPSS